MRVLVVGQGGREHALAWALARSAQVDEVIIAPGNGGTATVGRNVNVPASDLDGLVRLAQTEKVDLVVVGPEAPLAAGLVDRCRQAGVRAFGPTAAAAQIEASKAFAKTFMAEEGIPTARFAVFDQYEAARAHLRRVDYPVVIKASGLAAGKGVILPNSREEAEAALHRIMVERAFGAAGDQVVIEERLTGREVSIFAFTDGDRVLLMPPAQDYKRAYDHDQGPNTGGMGAYAPVPWLPPETLAEIERTILQPTVRGMQRRGTPYVGVLYAGLMITPDGPRVLEFNCRFGDPEAQVILPLLESDLVDVLVACLDGCLDRVRLAWKDAAAVTVVLASGGYPGAYRTGYPITGLEAAAAMPDVLLFHAGTARRNGTIVTHGGRVLNVTGLGPTLADARTRAYAAISHIHFEEMHYRRDIATTPNT